MKTSSSGGKITKTSRRRLAYENPPVHRGGVLQVDPSWAGTSACTSSSVSAFRSTPAYPFDLHRQCQSRTVTT